jgi:hypothetical protein
MKGAALVEHLYFFEIRCEIPLLFTGKKKTEGRGKRKKVRSWEDERADS